MNALDLRSVERYVNETIEDFHRRRLSTVENLSLNKLLQKNPYLFRAKNLTVASDLIGSLLDAFLSSSEEKLFGDFLENLALFVAQQTTGGHKSTTPRRRSGVYPPQHALCRLDQVGPELGQQLAAKQACSRSAQCGEPRPTVAVGSKCPASARHLLWQDADSLHQSRISEGRRAEFLVSDQRKQRTLHRDH